jgi:uncharacterized protein (DUF1015 family)
MVDFRPLEALRYNPAIAGDAANLVAPPYDVVSDADRAALHARSAYNVSRIDYPEGADYALARLDIEQWLTAGVLTRDSIPDLYVYDQEFRAGEAMLRRRTVFGRLRLEEWEKGIVLPHEITGAAAKADRLALLEATHVHLSPIMAMYKDVQPIADADLLPAVLDAVLPEERHTLRPVRPEAADAFCAALSDQKLYVADGHHRYETGINYRNEVRAAAKTPWSGEEPANFILAGLVSITDPGLVILPTHRLIKLPSRENGLRIGPLARFFELEPIGPINDANLRVLESRMTVAAKNGSAFGAVGLEPGQLHLITPRDLETVIARTPKDHKREWRQLDVTILAHAVLPAIGFDNAPEHIDYHEDASHVAEAVASGAWDMAFLVNPTPFEQVIACAEVGERMPRKTTFFFPKLGTGVVMLPMDPA